jgi:acyl carrier protein
MHSREKIFKTITEILEELFEIPPEKVKLESRLFEDLDLDSIDAVDLIVRLQQFVGQRIKPEEFKSVRTIEGVVAAAEKILHEHQEGISN